jgi:hypothetical protein
MQPQYQRATLIITMGTVSLGPHNQLSRHGTEDGARQLRVSTLHNWEQAGGLRGHKDYSLKEVTLERNPNWVLNQSSKKQPGHYLREGDFQRGFQRMGGKPQVVKAPA